MDTVTAQWLKAIFYMLFANIGIGMSGVRLDFEAPRWEFWVDIGMDVSGFLLFGITLWIALMAIPNRPSHHDNHD